MGGRGAGSSTPSARRGRGVSAAGLGGTIGGPAGGGAAPTGTPQNPAPNGFTGTVNGKDISDTWRKEVRNEHRAVSIQRVMDEQGFRGKPRIITDQAEFDKAAAAAWGGKGMVMVRGIGAPDQTTLDAYSDTLTEGTWYVSCSGGAAHGMGQYAVYRYGETKPKQSDVAEAKLYARHHGSYTKIFTMTLDPSAKIGEESKLESAMQAHNISTLNNSSAVQAAISKASKGSRTAKGVQDAIYDALHDGKLNRKYYGRSQKTYNKMMDQISDALWSEGKSLYTNLGIFAAAKGYDFYYDRSSGYSVTLNRTKLIIKG